MRKKSSSTKSGHVARKPAVGVPKITTSVLIRTPAPFTEADTPGSLTRLRPWQAEAVRQLSESECRMLIAPTGAGKSIVVKALALRDLTAGAKVIIAVPQIAIGHGYADDSLELEGVPRDWQPAYRIGTSDVRDIVGFLLDNTPGTNESGRALVCTHQALVLAGEDPRVKTASEDPWRNVSLFLDEAHHSLSSDDAHVPSPRRPTQNLLGALVVHYLRENSGPLTLITATWMRTDEGAIVPRHQLSRFAGYVRSFDDHVRALQHVRTIEVRFVVGPPTACLETLLGDRHPADAKTIVYQPAPGSDFLSAAGGKHDALAAYRNATGWRRTGSGPWDVHDFRGRPFTALDLVTDDQDRPVALARFIEGVRSQRVAGTDPGAARQLAAQTPDVIWALNMLREGSDYPALTHAILMAPRGSMLDTLQMFGRLLRDYPGKEHVQFDIVLPLGSRRRTPRADQVASYLRTMMATVLVAWQFAGLGIDDSALPADQRAQLAPLEQADAQQQIITAIVDSAIAIGDSGQSHHAEAVRIADRAVAHCEATKRLADGPRRVARVRIRQMLEGANRMSAVDFGVNMQEGLLGALRSFSGQFGYADLRRLRESLGRAAPVSLQQVHDAMQTFVLEQERWPDRHDGAIPTLEGSWLAIDEALRVGVRGLPGGSSLAKERVALTGARRRQSLTEENVKAAILAHHRATGAWPNDSTKGVIPGVGYTWSYVRAFIRNSGHGFHGLVRELQGLSAEKTRLTLASVEEAIAAFRTAHDGRWPTCSTAGTVPILDSERPTLTWSTLDTLLAVGTSGLPKVGADGRQLSLARVVAGLRGVVPSSSPLTLTVVEEAMLEWKRKEGTWPTAKTSGKAPIIDVTWKALNIYLQRGKRSLPGGLTLKRVEGTLERRVAKKRRRSRLSR